jgi:putative flavoprotein involved in K+ transport
MDASGIDFNAIAEEWLNQLEQSITSHESHLIESLFLSESYWRDALALTWKIQTIFSQNEICEALACALKKAGAYHFKLDFSDNPPSIVNRIGTDTMEAFFKFETTAGRGRGIIRLCSDASDGGIYKAWTFLTALEELKGFEEKNGAYRPTRKTDSLGFVGPNWLDQRQTASAYLDCDPTVLIIGGGQAGLTIAARLTQLGVDNLIVDKHARIGDNWRQRYHSLTLHNQVQVNHLPYMPFPPTWPTYIPKDMLANWFEAYVDAMELNYWTGNEVIDGAYDDTNHNWIINLKSLEGNTRCLKPRHIVMATGASGIPNIPNIPTIENYKGPIVHSSTYKDGVGSVGKKVLVLGTGNSGHDIAQDLYSNGANVTMIQRNSTMIVDVEPSAQLPYALYDSGPSLEDCDLITLSTPVPLARRAHVEFTRRTTEIDKDLLNGLKKIGFKLDYGDQNTGWQFKYLTRGGGYYFNVGCSNLLVEGKINLLQYDKIGTFSETGLTLKDGTSLDADMIVLATGYKAQEAMVAGLFGDSVAKHVGPIWGFGDSLELRNMYCRTSQPGLWFIAGSFAQCRINSKFLGLQIKALEEGLI